MSEEAMRKKFEEFYDSYECCEHEDNEELWEYKEVDKKHKIWVRTCLKCGTTEEEALLVKYWKDKFIMIRGKRYQALKAWGNISLCSECGDIVWHPIILWDSSDSSKAVTFHQRCAEKIGLFDSLKHR